MRHGQDVVRVELHVRVAIGWMSPIARSTCDGTSSSRNADAASK
jgi:hypothetical protein